MSFVADDDKLVEEIEACSSGCVRQDVSGADVTTLKIGGLLRNLVTLQSSEHAVDVVSRLKRAGKDWRILGAGSNILVGDSGIRGWTLRLSPTLRSVTSLGGGRFSVDGALSLMSLARELSGQGYSGLEFAGGIPASIGGAVYMNAGAHGGEIGSVIESIRGVSADGEQVEIRQTDLPWRYRSSGLPAGFIVLAATLRLTTGEPQRIQSNLQHNLAERKKRQPLTKPSAGSIFKNPTPEMTAGKLIEDAGLKGYALGGAQISDMHANWIVNPDRRATAKEVLDLIEICRKKVKEIFGVVLEAEVRRWVEGTY